VSTAAVKEKRGSVAARVFVDTNVLFPFSVMDVMLALTEDSIHEIVWSERLLAEWERVIVREGRRSAGSAAAVAQAVRIRTCAGCIGSCRGRWWRPWSGLSERSATLQSPSPMPSPDSRRPAYQASPPF